MVVVLCQEYYIYMFDNNLSHLEFLARRNPGHVGRAAENVSWAYLQYRQVRCLLDERYGVPWKTPIPAVSVWMPWNELKLTSRVVFKVINALPA